MSGAQNGGGGHRIRWLLSSSAVSHLGDGISKVAFPLLATSLTHDPVLIAGLTAIQFLPWLLFAAVAGTLVDRIDRRRAMLVANTARAAGVGLLALLVGVGGVTIWAVYAAALIVGTAETVADSAANVLIPAVAGRGALDSANSKLQACEIVGQTFVGPPVGATAFALFAAFPFLLGTAGFGIAAVVLLGLTGGYGPRGDAEPTRLRADLAAGLRWIRRRPLLLRLVAIAGLLSLISELAQAQLVLYAVVDRHLSDAAFGLFTLVGGVGGLGGAALAARLVRLVGRRGVLVGGIVGCAAGFGGMGLVTSPVAGAVLFGVFAAAIVAVNVVLATARQTLVPGELLGRVLGVWRTVVWGTIPLGALLGGLLTKALGTATRTFGVSGAAMLAVAVFALVSLRKVALDDKTAPASAPAVN